MIEPLRPRSAARFGSAGFGRRLVRPRSSCVARQAVEQSVRAGIHETVEDLERIHGVAEI